MASTSILPLQLGQAILGRALEPDAPAPEYVQIDGECWKLVTDPAAIQAAQDALEAREKASEAFAMAQYAPRIANRPPVAEDAEGKAPGAGWLEYDPATQLLKQMWRWTGQAWEELPMDPVMIPIIQIGTGTAGDLTADRLIVTNEFVARVAQILELSVENLVVTEGATINELVALSIASATAEFQTAYIQNLRSNGAVIDEAVIGDLAANIITSGLFRTASEGQRLEIDSSGLVMFGLDADGIDFEMVRIGPSGDNLITLGDTTVSASGIQAPSGEFEQIAVAGEDLSEILSSYGRGVIGVKFAGYNSAWHGTNTDVRRLEAEATLLPGRRYRIVVDSHYVQLRSGTSMTYVEQLRQGLPGSIQVIAENRWTMDPTTVEQTVGPLVGRIDTRDLASATQEVFGLTVRGPEGRDHRIVASQAAGLRITIEDTGPSIRNTGTSYMDEGTPAEGTASAPPKETPTKRYTKTYSSVNYYTYDNNGNATSDPDVVQGLYAGGPSSRLRKGGWTFPSMTGDLAGATIEKVVVKLYLNHSWYTAGATVNVCTWGGVLRDTLTVQRTVTGWKRNTSKWLELPSSTFAGFKSGAIDGIGVKPTTTFAEQYARFATSAKIEITFTK
ncbi:MAG: hypothetical protein ACTIA5_01325 [Brachybacterium tyrofermentans]